MDYDSGLYGLANICQLANKCQINQNQTRRIATTPMKKKPKTPTVPLKTCSLGRFTSRAQFTTPPGFPHLPPAPLPFRPTMRLYKHVIE